MKLNLNFSPLNCRLSRSPCRNLFSSTKFYIISIVFKFSWDQQSPIRKLKTNLMHNFVGKHIALFGTWKLKMGLFAQGESTEKLSAQWWVCQHFCLLPLCPADVNNAPPNLCATESGIQRLWQKESLLLPWHKCLACSTSRGITSRTTESCVQTAFRVSRTHWWLSGVDWGSSLSVSIAVPSSGEE